MIKKTAITAVFLLIILFTVAQNRQFSTLLPLVFIDTEGRQIPDEPKILVNMGIIWNGEGNANHTSDPFNHYNGKIAIEIRGSSSQMFPKKSFGFETKNDAGEDIDFPLLGLPEEEDWIFYGPYSDKSLIRNALVFTLAQSLEGYASRFRFVELFLNNQYHGIYLLMEKIKRDKTRVDIAKLNPDEVSGADLTGGYIIKIDKTTGSGGGGWFSPYRNSNGNSTFYQYEVPADDEIVNEQKNYIRNYITQFEEAMYSKKFQGIGSYKEYIDIPSFVDYILINELSKNIDGYRLSTFLHKDKNQKLKAGPIWDFNLAFGNANYQNAWTPYDFQIYAPMTGDSWVNPFWWSGMLADTAFTHILRCRWNELREKQWTNPRIAEITDSLVQVLDGAIARNFERWPVLGQYVWPNYYVAATHRDEILWMNTWLTTRLYYIDTHLPGRCGGSVPPSEMNFAAEVFPNPFVDELKIKVSTPRNANVRIQLFNVGGSLIAEEQFMIGEGEQVLNVRAEALPKGLYVYVLWRGNTIFKKGKIVKL
jgi:hypothetical protein